MKYVLRRIAMFLVALLAISLIVFLMLRVLPGDIAAVMAGTNSPPERVAQ
jgi:peptide/nickel transport system permease protein